MEISTDIIHRLGLNIELGKESKQTYVDIFAKESNFLNFSSRVHFLL